MIGTQGFYDSDFTEEFTLASQSPFFGKRERDADAPASRPAPLVGGGTNLAGSPLSTSPLGGGGTGLSGTGPVAQAGAATQAAAPAEGGSKLTVGPNIKLKGVEITDCDTLIVEGTVEATMDSRVMQIAQQGAFKGSAEIDVAEIRGTFDGDLTVREKLVIHATGKVTGKIRYAKIVIEEGGQISGEITFGASAASGSSGAKAATKPA